MDRIDIQKYFKTVDIVELSDGVKGPSSKSLMERVEVARTFSDMNMEEK